MNFFFVSVDIGPGQTVQVTVDVIIPPNVAETVNKVTLRVEGIEVVEKSVNFYIRSSISRVNFLIELSSEKILINIPPLFFATDLRRQKT